MKCKGWILALSVVGMMLLPSMVLANPSTKYPANMWTTAENPQQSWIKFEKPVGQGPRHQQWSWLPEGKFPYEKPYTGEEMAYHRESEFLYSSMSQDYTGFAVKMNKRGHMIQQNFFLIRENYYEHWSDPFIYDSGKVKTGDYMRRQLLIFDAPPEARGLGQVAFDIVDTPSEYHYADKILYVPSMRRTRRITGGDKQDDVFGYDFSNDDNGMRRVWEETYEIIGTDILYTKDSACASHPKYGSAMGGKIIRIPNKELQRPDGGYDCYVVKTVNKNPNYYAKFRLVWLEKNTLQELRSEFYNQKGLLKRIHEWVWDWKGKEPFPLDDPGKIPMWGSGWSRNQLHFWDLELDHQSWAYYGGFIFHPEYRPDGMFTKANMVRENFWRPAPKGDLYKHFKSYEEALARPPLLRGRFPELRKIELPGELEEKLKKEWEKG